MTDLNCDEYLNMYPKKTINKDLILYSGGNWSMEDICPDKFKYLGTLGIHDGKQIYLTNSLNAAEKYAKASSKKNQKSWIKTFKTKKKLNLLDITEDQYWAEGKEIDCICDNLNLDGYFLNHLYDNKNIEIFLCNNLNEKLEYITAELEDKSFECDLDLLEKNKNLSDAILYKKYLKYKKKYLDLKKNYL